MAPCPGGLHPVKNPLTLLTHCTFPGPFFSHHRPDTRTRLWRLSSRVDLCGNLGCDTALQRLTSAHLPETLGASGTCCFFCILLGLHHTLAALAYRIPPKICKFTPSTSPFVLLPTFQPLFGVTLGENRS